MPTPADDLARRQPCTLPAHFQRSVARAPEALALQRLGDNQQLTWREYAHQVRRLAEGLAGLGVQAGDPVGLLLTNRPEFHVGDTAALHLGAIPFSLYLTSTDEHLAESLDHSGTRVLLTERALLDRVTGSETHGLVHVVVLDAADASELSRADRPQVAVHTVGDLPDPPPDFDFEDAWRSVLPEDTAVLIYTSGTTGEPKCVELTHDNIDFALWSAEQRYGVPDKGALVSYLPTAHIADRLFAHYPNLALGWPVTTVEDPHYVSAALAQVHPTWFLGVPRIWERMRAGLDAKFTAAGSDSPERAQRALAAARERIRCLQAGQSVSDELAAEVREAEKHLLGPLRAQLGLDAAAIVMSGAAPLAPAVHEFFLALGVPLAEGFGMSESSGIGITNEPGDICIGRVGTPMPGTEARIGDDGALLLRGPHLMKCYRGDPGRSREVLDADGWLHTGDVAEIDDQGRYRVIDRRDEMIVSSTGVNMSPVHIESTLKGSSTLIGQVACVGDGRPHNVALIVLDPDAATAYATRHGIDDDSVASVARDPRVRAEVARAVEDANSQLAEPERIRRYELLSEQWLPDSVELTPAMKLRRRAIEARHAQVIESLYS
jgi:long-chain acyl-CoA synthetase